MKHTYFCILLALGLLLVACKEPTPKVLPARLQQQHYLAQQLATARDSNRLSLKKRKEILQQTYRQVQQLPADGLQLELLGKASREYVYLGDSSQFRAVNNTLFQASAAQNSPSGLGKAHWHLGFFLEQRGRLDSAFYHYRNSLEQYKQLPPDSATYTQRGRRLYSMAGIQSLYKDYLGADSSLVAAIKNFRHAANNQWLYNSYNMLGGIAIGPKEADRALRHFGQAKHYLEKTDLPEKETWLLQNNRAYAYLTKGAYAEAQNLYAGLLGNTALRKQEPKRYARIMTSQAYAYFKGEHNVSAASALLTASMAMNERLQFWHDQCRAQYYYAELLASQGDISAALHYAKLAQANAEVTSNNQFLLRSLKMLSRIDSVNSRRYSEDYYALSDYVYEQERNTLDKFARLRLETNDVIAENQRMARKQRKDNRAAIVVITFSSIGFSIVLIYFYRRARRHKKEREKASKDKYDVVLAQHIKIEAAKREEKKRISGELHDGVLGHMLGVRLILGVLNKKTDLAAVTKRREMINSLNEIEENIRNVSHELHKEAQKEMEDFIAVIEKLLSTTREAFNVHCTFVHNADVAWNALPPFVKVNLYRITQEAMKNGMTHGRCTAITITLSEQHNTLVLSIADNGIGFDLKQGREGIGLKNIDTRVQKLAGKLAIDSAKNKGTTIKVVIPKKYVAKDENPEAPEENKDSESDSSDDEN